MPRVPTPYQLCLAILRRHGLLMSAGEKNAGVASVVAFLASRGAQWRDPAAGDAGAVGRRLAAHRDVVQLKLVGDRSTLVHRTLWPDLLAMALSGAPWQVEWLPRREKALLELVEKEGRVVVDAAVAERLDASLSKFGRELEKRLLVLSNSGTAEPTGRVFTSWWTWAEEQGVAPCPNEEASRLRMEAAARTLGPGAKLPWFRASVRRRY